MRTIKRISLELNNVKFNEIKDIAIQYSKEKQYWLNVFSKKENIQNIKHSRKIRDSAIKNSYKSANDLQARMWKLALTDSAETKDKYYQSTFEKVRSNIHKNERFGKDEKHYAFWILKNYANIQALIDFNYPEFKESPEKNRSKVGNYLNRQIKKYSGKTLRVKLARSFVLDSNCYDVFTHNERQYISIMTLTPRKRLKIPLSGTTIITGNIRVIITKDNKVEIHYSSEINKKITRITENIVGVDFGYSEVITDSNGNRYGETFGATMTTISDALKLKMQKRHKLHALAKKYIAKKTPYYTKKAKKIIKHNLGRKKFDEVKRKAKSTLETQINTVYNELATTGATCIVSEKLSNTFTYKMGKNWNRRLSSWVRGTLRERLEFKALAKGFSHKAVNPAYSSQTCICCDFVDSKNRNGDRFKCLKCKYVNHADTVGATNLKNRYYDKEITLYTPYSAVKKILSERFHRRLEIAKASTVSGRILDTKIGESTTLVNQKANELNLDYDCLGFK